MMQQGERCASLHKGILPHTPGEKPRASADPVDLSGVPEGADFDSARLLERTNSVEYIAKLDKNTNAAADRGVFGSPSLTSWLRPLVQQQRTEATWCRREINPYPTWRTCGAQRPATVRDVNTSDIGTLPDNTTLQM